MAARRELLVADAIGYSVGMLPRYSPSGRCTLTLLFFVIPAFGAAVLTAGAYTLLSHWVPYIMLDLVLTFLCAVALDSVAKFTVHSSKCRNPTVGATTGALLGLIAALASHYVAYLWEIRSLPAGTSISLLDFIRLRVDTGWSIGKAGSGIPLTGWAVWIVWAIEAAFLIGGGYHGGDAAAHEPFCESCDRWSDKQLHAFDMPGLSPESIQKIAEASDVESVMLPPLNEVQPGPVVLKYRVRSCPMCDQSSFLDMQLETTTVNDKGKKSVETKPLGDCILLTQAEAEAVGQLKADVAAALAVMPTNDPRSANKAG